MYVIEVIPLVNLPPQVPQLLSYFYSEVLLRGAVVEISLNNRKVPAIVISSSPIEGNKILLKKTGFQLKKISSVTSEKPLVSDNQFKIALWLAKNYFAPLGMCFKTVLPHFFLKMNSKSGDLNLGLSKDFGLKTPDSRFKPQVLLTKAKDIIKNIEPEIKKVLKNKRQVLIIVPEISIAHFFYNYFGGYYETALIHSRITSSKIRLQHQKISLGEAEVIIGTRQALFAPFFDLGLVIIEDPANIAYKSDMTPKYNTRDLVAKVADLNTAQLLFTSAIPDITSFIDIKNRGYELINKKGYKKIDVSIENSLEEIKSGNFNMFSRNLRRDIEKYARDNKKILLFSARKGYATSLACENCGFYFKCRQCSVPLKIYKLNDLLVCHRCSFSQKIPDHCPNCRSYKLKSAGYAGTEKIDENLRLILESAGIKKEVFIFDSDTAKSPKQESELVEKMADLDSYICIATQAIFGRRFELNFDLIGIINLDGLTVFPDFKTEEDLLLQFEKLIDFNPDKVIVQTFNSDNQVLEFIKDRDYVKFYEKELPVRELFSYPPFAKLVKLSYLSPDKNKADYEARILNEKLRMVIAQKKLEDKIKILGPSQAFIDKVRNQYIYNLILKFMPSQTLHEILRFVPSSWSIDVDPRSIL